MSRPPPTVSDLIGALADARLRPTDQLLVSTHSRNLVVSRGGVHVGYIELTTGEVHWYERQNEGYDPREIAERNRLDP